MCTPTGAIAAQERIARYVFERSYYRRDGTPTAKAFHCDADNVCSVFRIDGLSPQEIFIYGNTHVASFRGKPVVGHIATTAACVRSARLDLRPAEPPPRHAEIIGYPEDRELMMERAQELASMATFVGASTIQP